MLLKCNRILKENKKYFFWLAYIIYLAELHIYGSVIGEIDSLKIHFSIIRNLCYSLICIKILIDFIYGEYRRKELIIITMSTLFLLILAKMTGDKSTLIYWIFIIAAHDIELKKIIRAAICVHIISMIVIIGSSLLGIIEDRIYTQGVERIRSSLGYQYTTDSSNYLLHITLMYVYLKREKISWESIGILGICNLLLFKLTDTKSAFVLVWIVLGFVILLKRIKILRRINIIYKAGTILAVPILAGTMISLTLFFDKQIIWMSKLNDILSGRLELGFNAYKTYGLHLLGQKIRWVGAYYYSSDSSQVYNYVDSSYVQILINYGILFIIIICLFFSVHGYMAVKRNDTYLMLIIMIIAIHSALDPQLLWMAYNPFVMCFFYNKKRESKNDQFPRVSIS